MVAVQKVPTTWRWCLIGDTLLAVPAAVPVALLGVLMLLHSACFAFIRYFFTRQLITAHSCMDLICYLTQIFFWLHHIPTL